MGVVNVTPDSFSDGGLYYSVPGAVAHALALLEHGADIIDIGGESTRPAGAAYGQGWEQVDQSEECRRVLPVIQGIMQARPDAVISVDTVKPGVASAALGAGARIINDVSAGQYDPAIQDVAAGHDVPYILMHGHNPRNRAPAESAVYDDVVQQVYDFLEEAIQEARGRGVRQIVADVGIGFAKGAQDNIRLLRGHSRFLALGVPLLAGVSRKAFIGGLLGGVPPDQRLYGTLAACAVAALNGATVLRVHDVAAMRQFLTVFQALYGDN